MAVFPDRIVLKNSTDSQSAIETAIGTGGSDEIAQGEIVLGINTTDVKFYTKAGDGSIVTLGGTVIDTLEQLTDVDLSTPATDSQILAYNATSTNWEPITSDLSFISDVDLTNTPLNDQILAYDSVNGVWKPKNQTASASTLGELTNVQDEPGKVPNFTSFGSNDPTFTDPDPLADQGTKSDELGDSAYKVLASQGYGDGSKLNGFLSPNGRYDIVYLRIRSANAIDTNNRVSLGGNKQELTTGAGIALYTRATGFGVFGNNAFQEIGTKPVMNANTWYEITYVLDWGSVQRTSLPTVSLWVDGAIAVDQVTPSFSYTGQSSPDDEDFRIAFSPTTLSNSGDKFWDDIRVVTANSIPWGMSDATITNPASLMDSTYGDPPITDGYVLTWVEANSQWEPAASTGEGGGGGYQNTTVVAPFAFGYIDATTAGTGTEVSWGTYDAGTGNISVTFDTAQSDTSYVVFTDCETADDIGASVSSKTTSGFTLSLYDFSTGNPSSPAVHPLTFQVFSSDGTQQIAIAGSTAGVYLSETQIASSGAADFVELGYAGIIQKVSSSLDAWIVLYPSAAERTADASRGFNTDPTPGSGVLFEAYVTASSTVIATPGASYFNNDTTLTEAVYAAVRDTSGNAVNASVTFDVYGIAGITSVSGGTFGSG